ncbi:DUF3265 domain-containing protein [Vibrio vulnificus]|nr:DUF3265 domain-containing protein [Vibrio vulnificus]EJS4046599.1 DUF3265 domain-containing protein [Vibrio vulnificus]
MCATKRTYITNNLRVIRHAWHFYYALVLVIKVVCGSIVLRASHLNWALCLIKLNQWFMVFFVPSAFQFCVCRQVGFFERCFSDTYSLVLEIQRIASFNSRASARLGRLA